MADLSENRIRRIVYCAEQLMSKRSKIWATRYERACSQAETVDELDEALLRIHAKFPHLKLDEIVEEERNN